MTMIQNSKSPRLILASTSPRRRDLLAALEIPFEVVNPAIDETTWPGEMPASFALRMAHEKAEAALADPRAGELVVTIAADTIVVLGHHILGKPSSPDDAAATLRRLSGRPHVVITGLCVCLRSSDRMQIIGDAVRTTVVFRHLTDAEIHHYVATGEPMDKAGSYAIQGGAAGMIEHIDGSYSNVVGLPMETVTRIFTKAGLLR